MRNQILLVIWLVAGTVAWSEEVPFASLKTGSSKRHGAIAGQVKNVRGVMQRNIPITITRQDGLFTQKIYSGTTGRFDLGRLLPGLYAVEVSVPNFLPFSKAPIAVRAGADVLININLQELINSVEIGLPADAAGAQEDWKWTLRSATQTRPILRFQEDSASGDPGDVLISTSRPVHGTVLISAGNVSRGFGAGPGLRTIFDVMYDWTGDRSLDFAGSAGWERGTPAASFRAGWNHQSVNGSNSSLSATMRQLFLPPSNGPELTAPGQSLGRRIQSFSAGYENEMAVSEHINVQYGGFFDSLSLGRRLSRWSPFGQLTYSTDQAQWTVAYTAEAPRMLPSGLDRSPGQLERFLAIPQVSSSVEAGDGRAALESGKHVEVSWQMEVSPRYAIQAAAFYDALTNVPLSLSGGFSRSVEADLLKDPFSDTYFLNGGSYSSPGARASLRTRLSNDADIIVGYTYAAGLQAFANELDAASAQMLREMVRTQREHSFVVKIQSTMPRTRTQILTSYRWIGRNAIVAVDPYDNGMGQSEPYLNVAVIQPLPSPDILPAQFQATADFSNVLAQGYLLIYGPDGSRSYFFPSARSFRGGFSFVF